jgi:HEAT repeat protein
MSRWAMAEALGKMGEAVVPLLHEALQDRNVEVRRCVIQALQDIGSTSVPSLIQALSDSELTIRLYAISALGSIGDSTIIPHLIKILENASEESLMRERASEILGQLGGTAAISTLINTLLDQEDAVRRNVAKALRKIGNPAVPQLIETLHSAEGELRRRITTLLKQIGTPEALSAINTRSRR